jgi:hypothetical protein
MDGEPPTPPNPDTKFKIWRKDFYQFLCALWPSTAGFITGGSVAAVIGVYCALGGPLPKWAVWSLVALAFFASAFRAYRKQRQTAEIIKINFHWPLTLALLCFLCLVVWFFTLPPKPGPAIETRMVDLNAYVFVTVGTNHAAIFWLEIYNPGRPTVIRDWALTVTNINGPEVFHGLIPRGYTGATNGLNPADYIWQKTRNRPIPTGGMENGYLIFGISGGGEKWLKDPDTIYQLTFRDVYGYSYTNFFHWPAPDVNDQ